MTTVCKLIKVILLKMCENQEMNLLMNLKLNSCKAKTAAGYDSVFTVSRCRKILLLCGYRNKNLECDIHIDGLYMMEFC